MKNKTAIISVIISVLTIIFIALFTSAKSNEKNLTFSIPVKVENNQITSEKPAPVYFQPVG